MRLLFPEHAAEGLPFILEILFSSLLCVVPHFLFLVRCQKRSTVQRIPFFYSAVPADTQPSFLGLMGIEIEEGTMKRREDTALRIYFSSLPSLLFLGGDVRVAAMDALFTSSFSYSASLLSSSLPLSGSLLVSPSSAARCCTREQAAPS